MNQFKKLIKIWTIKKVVNFSDPTDHQDAVIKKYVDRKTEPTELFSFLSKYAPRSLFIEKVIKEKATC